MTERPRVLLFERGESAYPGGDSLAYAASLGCDSIALLLSVATPASLDRARRSGLRCWLWSGPSTWEPRAWRASAAAHEATLTANPWLAGVIVDQEGGWGDAPREAHAELQSWMERIASSGRGVAWTSYPAHRFWRSVATSGRILGMPQCYGVRDPGSPAELRERAEAWRRAGFAAGVVPVLAMWARDAPAQAGYLAAFPEGGGLWHATPAPVGPVRDAVAAWARSTASPAARIIATCLALAVAAAKLAPWL